MSLSDRVATLLAGPASRVLDTPIRDTIDAVLRDRGYAGPAELDTLRSEARELRSRLSSLQARVDDLATQLDAAHMALRDAKAAQDPRVDELLAQVSTLRARVRELTPESPSPRTERPDASAAPVPPRALTSCKVSGCGQPVRSKGFCSAHYQQWRRGTLPGYVAADGRATLPDGSTLTVSESHAGASIARDATGIVRIDGQAL